MKTLKDFIESRIVEEELPEIVEESQEIELLETEDYPLVFESDDKQSHSSPLDPPAVLIMRRKSIRQFPNGQRVALYFVDKINKYVTVPYTAMQWGTSTPEETVIDRLKMVVEDGEPRVFGNDLMVSKTIAKQFLNVYEKLNTENKNKLAEMAEININKAIDFVKKLSK